MFSMNPKILPGFRTRVINHSPRSIKYKAASVRRLGAVFFVPGTWLLTAHDYARSFMELGEMSGISQNLFDARCRSLHRVAALFTAGWHLDSDYS